MTLVLLHSSSNSTCVYYIHVHACPGDMPAIKAVEVFLRGYEAWLEGQQVLMTTCRVAMYQTD